MAKKKTTTPTLFTRVLEYSKKPDGKLTADIAKYEPEAVEGSTVCFNKEGDASNYSLFESLGGFLKDVYIYEKELKSGGTIEMLVVRLLNENNEQEVVEVSLKTAYAASLIKRLEELDVNIPVELKAFCIFDKEKTEEKGKDVYNRMLLPYQSGTAVKNPYVKGGKELPRLKEIKTTVNKKPKISYDDSELLEKLRELVKDFNAKLKGKLNSNEEKPEEKTDDLPF